MGEEPNWMHPDFLVLGTLMITFLIGKVNPIKSIRMVLATKVFQGEEQKPVSRSQFIAVITNAQDAEGLDT